MERKQATPIEDKSQIRPHLGPKDPGILLIVCYFLIIMLTFILGTAITLRAEQTTPRPEFKDEVQNNTTLAFFPDKYCEV